MVFRCSSPRDGNMSVGAYCFLFLMIRRPPRSTLFPTRRSSDLSAVDAGGTAFVVSEPTDKADPDYAAKKKAFDEYQAQAAKEPLAVKLADSVGHVRIATNSAWTL